MSVSDTCKITFEEIKKDKKHRYVIFFIRDEKQIDVEVVGARDAEYDSFLEDIQQGGSGECRYVTYLRDGVERLTNASLYPLIEVRPDCQTFD